MVLLRYLASILPSLAAIGAFLASAAWPREFNLIVGSWLLVLAAAHLFLGGGEARRLRHWYSALPAVALFVSSLGFVLFSESAAARLAVIFSVSMILAASYWSFYLYLHQPLRYTARSLEHLTFLSNVLSVFFGSVTLFGLRLYLSLAVWRLSLIVLFSSALLLALSFWAAKLKFKESFPLIVIFTLLLTELIVALTGLPIGEIVSGAVVALIFYTFAGVGRHVLSGTFTARIGGRFGAITGSGVLLVLITAQWS